MSFSHLISNAIVAVRDEAQALREASKAGTGTCWVSLTWGPEVGHLFLQHLDRRSGGVSQG